MITIGRTPFKSIFIPPGMTARLVRSSGNSIEINRQYVLSHEMLSTVERIDVFTWKEHKTLQPPPQMDRNYYSVSGSKCNGLTIIRTP